ncbi:MAG: metal-dependent transcriptional regulator [Bacteroidota bacterium]
MHIERPVSHTKENYLKAIYFLSQKNDKVGISDLANRMKVSKPTANDMVKKLKAKGWLKYEKYKPIYFTKQGEKEAALILRKHRLTEMFLSKVMGFGWEEVHDIAEEIEHIQSEKYFDRMDEILGFPTVDPHGSPIPDKKGKLNRKFYSTLSQISTGNKVRLCALDNSSTEFLEFLNKKGIKLGTELSVLEIEPFDQSMRIASNGSSNLVLSKEICDNLLVE